MPSGLLCCFTDQLCSGAVPDVRGVDGPPTLTTSSQNVSLFAVKCQRAFHILSSADGCFRWLESECFSDGDDTSVVKFEVLSFVPEFSQS